MRIITAVAVVLGAVNAVNAQVDFDRGVDLKSFLAQAEAQGPKAEVPAAAGRTCRLALDAGRTCLYKCEDGSTFTQANPFAPVTPNPWVGQIYPPCLPSAAAPGAGARGNMWHVLSKIKLNDKQPDLNTALVGLVKHGQNIDTVMKELTAGGFRVRAYQDNTGGYLVMAEVTAEQASDRALGLARYWYISEVLVGEKVFYDIFPKN